MEAIERAIQVSNPAVYQSYLGFGDEVYRDVFLHGLMDRNSILSMTYELKFYSRGSYMIHEIVELVYLENRKAPLKPNSWVAYLTEYWYWSLTDSHGSDCTLMEFIHIFFDSSENRPEDYVFGYASTDPVIFDFIQAISQNFHHKELDKIKGNLVKGVQAVTKALQRGVPYGLVAKILLKKCNFWIFNSYPIAFEDEKIGELFLGLSEHHDGPISAEAINRLSTLKHTLMDLANLSNKEDAMGKVLLLIYFPARVRDIYNSHPSSVFGAILMEKLTGWRRDMAMEIDWEGVAIRTTPLFSLSFNFTRDYFEGYEENSMFDSFILMLKDNTFTRQLNRSFFKFRQMPAGFFMDYQRKIFETELQGTIYSIIRDRLNLEWGPIDPLSVEIRLEFENKCAEQLWNVGYSKNLWLGSRYIDIISGTPVPISRLTYYSLDHYLGTVTDHYYCQGDQETTVEAVRRVYRSLANYCQPQEGYLERWDSYARTCKVHFLFSKIWKHNIAHCDLNKSFEKITKILENDQPNYLTKRFLLRILKSIVKQHFSFVASRKMNFNDWTDSLKIQLYSIFGRSHELNHKNDGNLNINNNDPPKG